MSYHCMDTDHVGRCVSDISKCNYTLLDPGCPPATPIKCLVGG